MTNSIPLELEKLIQDYEKHLFNPGQVWDYASLEVEVFKYFDQWGHDPSNTDDLFTRFARIWAIYYHQLQNFQKADEFWDVPLGYATRWEGTQQKHLHKATAYYRRGMAAVASGNIDRGFLFFHQAVDEDNRIPSQKGWGPAWSFVTFNFSDPRQAALPLLMPRAEWLGSIISKYKSSGRGSLTLAKLRRRILAKKRLKETTFSFTHAVFGSENLLSVPEGFRSSAFASQLELDILFSLCRIGEIWLTKKQGQSKGLLLGQLSHFFKSPRSHITRTDLETINKSCIANFEKCLRALLNNKKGSLPKRFQLWESDLILIYILRNEAGHAVTSSPVISERFSELLERVFFGLFKIVETLF